MGGKKANGQVEHTIPIVDLRHFKRSDLHRSDIEEIAQELTNAFKTWGFAYIINHTIPDEQVDSANRAAATFFQSPVSIKEKCKRVSNDSVEDFHGWGPYGTENFDSEERPPDYKEFFDVYDFKSERWPDETLPEFKQTFQALNTSCEQMMLDMFYLTAVGLKLEDKYYFINRHRFGEVQTPSSLRSNYYPRSGKPLKENQIACGEHTDFGTLTILLQDDIGGLQVWDQTQDKFVDATPMPGSVVVNIGDFLQRWTADTLVSTKHRVILPKSTGGSTKPRQSFAFFGHPDNDCVIECMDGSNKYPPISSIEYQFMRNGATLVDYKNKEKA